MTIATENTNLMHNILLALKADKKGVSQISIKIIRDTQVCASGDCYVIKPKRDKLDE